MKHQNMHLWLIFFAINLGIFIINVDGSIVNVAFPILQQTYGTSIQTLQWVITIYYLVITSILPVLGKLSDLIGRKLIFITGISIFLIASILCALSQSVEQLILFRAIQGVGGAMVMGNAMSIITLVFPEEKRGLALGGIGSVQAVATIVGPGIGGVLISWFNWRWIFWINIPFGILSILLTISYLELNRAHPKEKISFDYYGTFLFVCAMTSMMLFISSGNNWHWLSLDSILCLLISVVSWIGFIVFEKKCKEPLINLDIFKNPLFSLGNVASAICFILLSVPSIILPIYMKMTLNMSVDYIGLIMATQAVMMIVFSLISGWISDKTNPVLPSLIGMILTILGLFGMSQFNGNTTYFSIILSLSVFGAGVGLFQSPNNVIILKKVRSENMGLAGSLMATVRNFGRVLGAAVTILLYQVANDADWLSKSVFPESIIFYVSCMLGLVNLIIIFICMKLLVQLSNGYKQSKDAQSAS